VQDIVNPKADEDNTGNHGDDVRSFHIHGYHITLSDIEIVLSEEIFGWGKPDIQRYFTLWAKSNLSSQTLKIPGSRYNILQTAGYSLPDTLAGALLHTPESGEYPLPGR